MCGIYGAIAPQGKQFNLGIVSALTWANRERGTDSCGFFDSSGKMTKRAGDPAEVLRQTAIQKWLKTSKDRAWFIAGHTRFATRGKVNRRNSHPFRYGRIIGSHNGMVDAPMKFTVDSEYLLWSLNKARGDYNKALGSISGYFGLSWYDGSDFYLLCHSGELAVVELDGIWYYSSNWKHLDSCTGGDSHTFGEGEVWKFNANGLVGTSLQEGSDVKAFVSTAVDHWHYYSRGRYAGGYDWNDTASGHTRNYSSGGRGGPGKKASRGWWQDQEVDETVGSKTRDYDSEWADAWASYCSQGSGDDAEDSDDSDGDNYDADHASIHSMTDEQFEEFDRYAG